MWFQHPAWVWVAWILCVLNVGSVWFAAQPAEPWHATLHAALGVLSGLWAQYLANRPKSA